MKPRTAGTIAGGITGFSLVYFLWVMMGDTGVRWPIQRSATQKVFNELIRYGPPVIAGVIGGLLGRWATRTSHTR